MLHPLKFDKRSALVDPSELEHWLWSSSEETISNKQLASLIIFFNQFGSLRAVYRMLSVVYDVDYDYLYGAFPPGVEYVDFEATVYDLYLRGFTAAKFDFKLIPTFPGLPTERPPTLDASFLPTIDLITARFDHGLLLGSSVAIELIRELETQFDHEQMLEILWGTFGGNRQIIAFAIRNPTHQY